MIPLIAPTHYFKLNNGQIIKHLNELPEAIDQMDEDLFRNYVNDYKNDFARWIYDVYRLVDLSELLGKVKSKKESARVIRAYLHQRKNSQEKVVMRNSQETVQITKQEDAPQDSTEGQAEKKSKFAWKNNTEKKPEENVQKIETKEKEVEKQIIKEKNVQSNITKENINDADKYFDENPVLVSQIVEHKKKHLKTEKIDKIKFTETDKPKDIIELFKDTYTKIYENLVFLRKNGFDTKIIGLMLFRIPSKIKLYEASEDKKEAIQIQRYLNEVIDEMNNI